jgi:hypothetical protein
MNQPDIIAANNKSALEQIEQDERNDTLKAELKADALFNRPHKPSYFPEESPRETREKELQSIQRENVESSHNK